MQINLLAPINGTGYGVAGTQLLKALATSTISEVALFPIGPSEYDRSFAPIYDEAVARAGNYADYAPSVRMWHQDQLAEHVGNSAHIGFPFFELDRFTWVEEHHLRSMDHLFVASKWAQEVLRTELDLVETVSVVPLGVDREVFHEGLRQAPRQDPDTTVFINIGKWEIRKGHDLLLRAFNKAFQPSDKVQLRMINHNPFIGQGNDTWRAQYEASPMRARIDVKVGRLPTVRHVATALAGADCGVWPARAEGWNLEALEMLATGGHVIATNYSGHTEFLTKDNALLVQPEGTEDAFDGIWFKGQGGWANLGKDSEEQLIEHLRSVHRRKQLGELGVNEAGIRTAKRFSWENSAKCFVEGLESV